MKTGLANLTFCVTFHNFSCLILACLLWCSRLISFFFLFCCFLVRDLCRNGCRNNYHPHPPPKPSRPYVFALTHNSPFFSVWKSVVSCSPSARDSTSVNLHKTSVRKKSRGVYLPIGRAFPSYSMMLRLCWTWEDYAWLWIALSVPRKCVIVWFPHGVDRYAMSCLSAVSPKWSVLGINIVTSVFSLAYRTLEKAFVDSGNWI